MAIRALPVRVWFGHSRLTQGLPLSQAARFGVSPFLLLDLCQYQEQTSLIETFGPSYLHLMTGFSSQTGVERGACKQDTAFGMGRVNRCQTFSGLNRSDLVGLRREGKGCKVRMGRAPPCLEDTGLGTLFGTRRTKPACIGQDGGSEGLILFPRLFRESKRAAGIRISVRGRDVVCWPVRVGTDQFDCVGPVFCLQRKFGPLLPQPNGTGVSGFSLFRQRERFRPVAAVHGLPEKTAKPEETSLFVLGENPERFLRFIFPPREAAGLGYQQQCLWRFTKEIAGSPSLLARGPLLTGGKSDEDSGNGSLPYYLSSMTTPRGTTAGNAP